jgi:hypothetical protein
MATNQSGKGGIKPGDMGKILFAVLLLAAAAGIIFWTIKSQQGYEVGRINAPPGGHPKVQAMKAMKNGQAPPDSGGKADPNSLGDRP